MANADKKDKERAAFILVEAGFSYRTVAELLSWKSPRSVQYAITRYEERQSQEHKRPKVIYTDWEE